MSKRLFRRLMLQILAMFGSFSTQEKVFGCVSLDVQTRDIIAIVGEEMQGHRRSRTFLVAQV
jgi:hypothetical protein